MGSRIGRRFARRLREKGGQQSRRSRIGQGGGDGLAGRGCRGGSAGRDAPGARRHGWLRPMGEGGAAHRGSRRGLAAGAKKGSQSGHVRWEGRSGQESSGDGLSRGGSARFVRRMRGQMTGEAADDWG
jgi:hypothetical protein